MPQVHEIPEEGLCTVNAVFVEINNKKIVKTKKIREEIKI